MELRTLENALNVLECFTRERASIGLREIARELGTNHTAVYRIVSTFERRGYLRKAPETGKYELGLKLLEHGFTLQSRFNVTDLIQPEMKSLSEQTGESVVLTWLDGREGVYIAIVESNRQVRFAQELGVRSPLYIGASHKTILAFLAPEVAEEIVATVPSSAPRKIDAVALRAELGLIRERGWCYSCGEHLEDVAALAVPIFDHRNEIVASLAIACPKFRFPQDEAMSSLPLLQESGLRINGYFERYELGGMRVGFP
ncbi:MAG: IclR family transcriptional regulator [Spirochaetales bacterium]|nr:IclR family transcriptional regulator [Spirochaetales bacterium]